MGEGNVPAAIAEAARQLQGMSDTPRLDAELLMAHALGMERSDMLLQMRDLTVPPGFEALAARRMRYEPLAYIRGYQDFWDLRLKVTPDVLIPRADSETLVEAARSHFSPLLFRGGVGGGAAETDATPTGQPHPNPSPEGEGLRVLDLGTGSGALLLAVLSLIAEAKGIGIDASPAALVVAKGNAEALGFGGRATFSLASWRETGWCGDLGQFDLILCNPPYVETLVPLQPSVQDFEPHQALYSGPEGLDDYRTLIPQIPALLARQGMAIFEIGKGQDAAVSNLAASAGLVPRRHRDLTGIVRALSFTAANSG